MKILSHDWQSNALNILKQMGCLVGPRLGARTLSQALGVALATVCLWGGSTSLSPATASTDMKALQNGLQKEPETLLIVGDSLSSEYGIRRGTGWVQLLRDKLSESDLGPVTIINASISGDTTSSGLTRLPTLLTKHEPSIVLIELGGNDALRGLSLDMTRANLDKMIDLSQAAGAQVIVAGMQIPPNYGPAYTKQFRDLFPDVAQENNAALIPFFLAGLEMDRSLFIEDGIHPAEHAQSILLDNVWPVLDPLLSGNDSAD